MWRCYDVALDKAQDKTKRIKYAIRLVTSSLITYITLLAIYTLFKVNTNDLFYYLKYGGYNG